MGSRIMPALADGRSFTNYVSSGIYNNYLEDKFKVDSDSSYRQFLQKNAKQVEKVTNALTAYYVKPPTMPKVTRKVQGEPDAHMIAGPAGKQQTILDAGYYNNLSRFNLKTRG
jgi:hypothetical protein